MVLDNSLETTNVKKIPSKITKITAKVETIEAPKPLILPAIKIVAIAIKKGKRPVTRDKIISQNSNQSFTRRINDSTTNTTSSITAKSHAHGNHLFTGCNSTS